ncbi:hypothetical protein LshimejAT787_0209860 [Lyophyllum shimeji]|uniref:rRNA-processing protein FYV7 n=1 Tax=Lyophyllum shimeji TaxID=47721 RepID=A0A9P3PGI4_LYOSH|nr:hypothetical protein LshimejAT787_0209860 [Lyophyllum shimeji]
MAETNLKRKRPPTFPHLPLNRATKLKRTWVENKKIKSKWKAQKRKEGLSTTPQAEDSTSSEKEESDPEGSASGSEQPDEEEEEEGTSELEETEPAPRKSTLHPSRAHIHPELAPAKRDKRRRPDEAEDASVEAPSLRELTRRAYSRSSLHTFKAGSGQGSSGRGRGRGGARARGGQRGETGRGQPNMKLRMEAMLEKIKQTIA